VPHIPLARNHAVVLAVALLVGLALLGRRLADADTARPASAAPAALAQLEAAAPARLVVHVAGAVRRPGLYRLTDGARVAEAVSRAGGGTRRADLSALNLAAPLVDGSQVLVPLRVPPVPAGDPGALGNGSAASGKVRLSTATLEQLDSLPGVGPVTAQKIVDWRAANGPFRAVNDLDAIPGIGPARLEQLRDLVLP
jgi:competence protein ComEA